MIVTGVLTCGVADGFFDAGMLLQAIKSSEEADRMRPELTTRRSVGKKLRLVEY